MTLDISTKAALRRVDEAVTELVTTMAREDGRPLVSNAGWALCMDNRYYEGGKMTAATISVMQKPNQPYYITALLVEQVFAGMNQAVEFEDEDAEDE